MNRALNRYQDNPRVMQISGHMFPVNISTETDALFLPLTTSWGWATWQRSWKYYDTKMTKYYELKNDNLLKYQFNVNGSYPYFKMLESTTHCKIEADKPWDIRWYLSVFMEKGLVLFPSQSLVKNIGLDGSGIHGQILINQKKHNPGMAAEYKIISYPSSCEVCSEAYFALSEYFKEFQRESKSLINVLFKKFSVSK
jgi:hypothetical protein